MKDYMRCTECGCKLKKVLDKPQFMCKNGHVCESPSLSIKIKI